MNPEPDRADLDKAGVRMVVFAVDGHDHVGGGLVPVVSALDIGASLLQKTAFLG